MNFRDSPAEQALREEVRAWLRENLPAGSYAEEVSLQLFSSPSYVEIETLGGLVTPAVGQKMENTVRWRLLERPKDLDETALARWLRAQLKT